jgi:hypothetical protein
MKLRLDAISKLLAAALSMMSAAFPLAASATSAPPPANNWTYCVLTAYLAGKTVSKTGAKVVKLAGSDRIDLNLYTMKVNKPGPGGQCIPTCRTSNDFGVRDEAQGRIISCSFCGREQFHTLELEFGGYRFKSGVKNPPETTQVKIEASVKGKPLKLKSGDYYWILGTCNQEKDAGFKF